MKLSELKHNHSLTDLLKILIFSILMLTPLLSVASRCMYVICNKNAYQSYNGNEKQAEYVNLANTPKYDCYININQVNTTQSTRYYLSIQNVSIISYNSLTTQQIDIINSATQLDLWNPSTPYFKFSNQTDTTGNMLVSSYRIVIKCDILTTSGSYDNLLKETAYIIKDTNSLDNVFEYSISQIENSEYYNWTQNTAVYTGVKAMTTNLQIEGNVIAILITYWFLLTVIYVIIDIVLKCFTTLTHLIGNKKV